jgi:hypothetical protein
MALVKDSQSLTCIFCLYSLEIIPVDEVIDCQKKELEAKRAAKRGCITRSGPSKTTKNADVLAV